MHSTRSMVIAVVLLLLAAFGAPLAATDVRAAGEPIVIVSEDEPRNATPSGDQTLRLAGPVSGLNTLDPALSRDLSSAFLIRQIFRGLTRLDKDLQPVPELASRIEISADGLVYLFTLRDGVTFQDGRKITAEDVVFSLNRAVSPATAGGDLALLGGPTYLSDISGFDEVLSGEASELRGVRAIDERTVEVTLSRPRSTFLMKIAAAPASIVDPVEVTEARDWWKDPNGSGPFRIAEWRPEEMLVLEPFDEFFAGRPPLDRVEIRLGANALQSFNLYQSGDIDVDGLSIFGIDRALASESGFSEQVTITPLFAVDYIALRTDAEPLDDPNIRRALQLAFPREKIAEVSYDGHVAAAQGLIPDGMFGQNWPVEWPAHDPEAAKAAIAESRYGSVENVPPIQIYVTSGYTGAESLRDYVFDSIGLRIDVIEVEWTEFIGNLGRRAYPAHELYWGADYPDPESLLESLFGSRSADNYTGYANDDFDALLTAAAQEADPQRRAELYAEAQQLLVDDGVVIPLYYDVAYTLQRPYVRGLELTALGILRLDSVWMER